MKHITDDHIATSFTAISVTLAFLIVLIGFVYGFNQPCLRLVVPVLIAVVGLFIAWVVFVNYYKKTNQHGS